MTNSKFEDLWNALLSKITPSHFQYKKTLFFGVPAFLVVIALGVKGFMGSGGQQTSHLAFQKSFDQWIAGGKQDEVALKNLQVQLKKMPELIPSYQWKIIQQCLFLKDVQSARSLLKTSRFTSKSSQDIYFQRFSEISILITNQEYIKAYEESLLLKEDLYADHAFWEKQAYSSYGSDLFAYNLLRIALLSQFTQRKEAELAAWGEVKKFGGDGKAAASEISGINIHDCKRLFASFSEEGVSLQDYILHRESLLLSSIKNHH